MTTHYSTKGFFRNTPNALLARYFKARGVLQSDQGKTKIEPLFEPWIALPERSGVVQYRSWSSNLSGTFSEIPSHK